MKPRIAIAGAVVQKPHAAGHTWQFLQYLLGFGRLGYDVLLIDRVGGGGEAGIRYLAEVMDGYGLGHAWSVDLGEGVHAGADRARVLEHLASSELLLNVMGFLTDEELLAAAPRRVFLDTDPGFAQLWHALGWADVLDGHDAHVTIGERVGREDCAIPTCGRAWATTRQPVVLEHWPRSRERPRRPFTSVATWRGAYDAIDMGDRRYGLRAHEFRRFVDLPAHTGQDFELALSIDPPDDADRTLLRRTGWTLLDPRAVASTPSAYRQFVRESTAEVMVAKNLYVETRGGWFSERSICYLASGRPVLAQDTGLADLYPLGEGLLAFASFDEAAAGVEAITADYSRHAAAARELAEELFDSDRVLTRLLEVV